MLIVILFRSKDGRSSCWGVIFVKIGVQEIKHRR